jgi:hypothetical protein
MTVTLMAMAMHVNARKWSADHDACARAIALQHLRLITRFIPPYSHSFETYTHTQRLELSRLRMNALSSSSDVMRVCPTNSAWSRSMSCLSSWLVCRLYQPTKGRGCAAPPSASICSPLLLTPRGLPCVLARPTQVCGLQGF